MCVRFSFKSLQHKKKYHREIVIYLRNFKPSRIIPLHFCLVMLLAFYFEQPLSDLSMLCAEQVVPPLASALATLTSVCIVCCQLIDMITDTAIAVYGHESLNFAEKLFLNLFIYKNLFLVILIFISFVGSFGI